AEEEAEGQRAQAAIQDSQWSPSVVLAALADRRLAGLPISAEEEAEGQRAQVSIQDSQWSPSVVLATLADKRLAGLPISAKDEAEGQLAPAAIQGNIIGGQWRPSVVLALLADRRLAGLPISAEEEAKGQRAQAFLDNTKEQREETWRAAVQVRLENARRVEEKRKAQEDKKAAADERKKARGLAHKANSAGDTGRGTQAWRLRPPMYLCSLCTEQPEAYLQAKIAEGAALQKEIKARKFAQI
ncbi:hypothetical protein B484DRAFT_400402, partial [Ochromonadaceae sp. CCMP2298]